MLQLHYTTTVLDIAKSNGYVESGCNVQIYTNIDPLAQEWFIIGVGTNTFKIVPRTNMSLALTAIGTSNGTSTGNASTSEGNVCVLSYTGASNQLWRIKNSSGAYISNVTQNVSNGYYYLNNANT